VALLERGTGRIHTTLMPRVTSVNLAKVINQRVAFNRARIMTDEAPMYGPINLPNHETVNHHSGEYVRGDVSTNCVEGFFSLLKRGINGVYHHVSVGHLQRYCDEFGFRYEHRKMTDGARAQTLVGMAEGKRLTFKQPAIAS
jgi:hypothetical protein